MSPSLAMRTGRKFSSKNARASSRIERAGRVRAAGRLPAAPGDIGRASRGAGLRCAGTAGSSPETPRRLRRDRPPPSRRVRSSRPARAARSGTDRCRASNPPAPLAGSCASRRVTGQPARAPACERSRLRAARSVQSLPGFGRDQLPVRIARGHSRAKVHTSVTSVTLSGEPSITLPARSRVTEISCDTKRTVTCAVLTAHLGADDVGLVDRDESRLDLLALGLAFADRRLEAVIDVAREQILQRARSPSAKAVTIIS